MIIDQDCAYHDNGQRERTEVQDVHVSVDTITHEQTLLREDCMSDIREAG
jgi:hypothetical protein